jgi:hypothetical protein
LKIESKAGVEVIGEQLFKVVCSFVKLILGVRCSEAKPEAVESPFVE